MKKFSIIFSFILLFCLIFSVDSLASTYQNPADVNIDTTLQYRQYFIFDNRILFICSDSPDNYGAYPLVRHDTSSGQDELWVRVNPGGLVQLFIYSLDANGNWVNGARVYSKDVNGSDYTTRYDIAKPVGVYVGNMIASSVDVYRFLGTNSHELVFPQTPVVGELTLAETVQALMEEEVPEAQSQVLGTMNILLLCGVGCLAFLTGLVLFGKVFRRFRLP